MNSEDGQVYSVWILQFSCFTVCSQNINKQIGNIAEFVTEFPCLLGHPVSRAESTPSGQIMF